MKAKFISYFLFMLAISFCVACSDDDNTDPEPTPDPAPEETVNTYTYKEKTVEAKSVICTDYFKGYYCIYMSPLMNLATIEDFTGSGREYVTFMIPQASANKELSLMDEENGCTIYYMDENSEPILASHDEETWENVSDGKISINLEDKAGDGVYTITAKFNITFKDGKSFTGAASSTYTPPTPLTNQVACGDEIIDIKSAYAMTYSGNQYIYFSPVANLTDVQDIADTENYMYIMLKPNMIGQDIHITTGTDYAIYHSLTWQNADALEKDLYIIESSWSEYCQEGTFKVESIKDNKAKFSFDITLSSGKSFRGAYEGPCTIENSDPLTTNILTVDGTTKSIRAALYMDIDDNSTFFYLTPAAIENLDELDMASYYVAMLVPKTALDGTEIDLSTTEDAAFYYVNNNTEDGEMFTGTSGKFSLKKENDKYTVIIKDVKGDEAWNISGNYTGKFLSEEETAKKNTYQLGEDTPVTINSVVVDKKSDETMCDIYLANGSGLTTVEAIKAANPIIVRIPKSALDGTPQAFSMVHSMSITYNDKAYNYKSADNGELNGGNASVDMESNNATINFTLFQIKSYNSQSLVGYYNGAVTIIE